MQIYNEEIDEIYISSVTSRWGHNKVARVLHVFRSNFWLAHRAMLKLSREV